MIDFDSIGLDTCTARIRHPQPPTKEREEEGYRAAAALHRLLVRRERRRARGAIRSQITRGAHP